MLKATPAVRTYMVRTYYPPQLPLFFISAFPHVRKLFSSISIMKAAFCLLALTAAAAAIPASPATFHEKRQGPQGPGGPDGPGGFHGPPGYHQHGYWDDDNPEYHDNNLEGLSDETARVIAATWLYFSVNVDWNIAYRLLDPAFTLYSDSDNVAGVTGVCIFDHIRFVNANVSNRLSRHRVLLPTLQQWSLSGISQLPNLSMELVAREVQ